MTTTDRDMREQVTIALQDFAPDYNVPAIVRDLIADHGRVDVGSIPSGPFWATVASWAACECGRAHAADEWACESSGADLLLGVRA